MIFLLLVGKQNSHCTKYWVRYGDESIWSFLFIPFFPTIGVLEREYITVPLHVLPQFCSCSFYSHHWETPLAEAWTMTICLGWLSDNTAVGTLHTEWVTGILWETSTGQDSMTWKSVLIYQLFVTEIHRWPGGLPSQRVSQRDSFVQLWCFLCHWLQTQDSDSGLRIFYSTWNIWWNFTDRCMFP